MIIDKLQNASLYTSINPRIAQAFEYLKATDLGKLAVGKHSIDGDNVFALVQEYETKSEVDLQMESHFEHIDVQYIISGSELMGLATKNAHKPITVDQENDYALYEEEYSFMLFEKGMFGIFFPDDLHLPCIHAEEPVKVKKVVVKIKIEQ
jgi:YhcH/YjgK/YiaL family protein